MDESGNHIDFRSRDISRSGIAIETPDAAESLGDIEVGSHVNLFIESKLGEIETVSRVIRIENNWLANKTVVGLEFSKIEKHGAKTLDKLLVLLGGKPRGADDSDDRDVKGTTLADWMPGNKSDTSFVRKKDTTVAVISYFWKDLITICKGSIESLKKQDYTSRDFRLSASILIGTIPVCVLGLLLKKIIESDQSPLRSMTVIGIASICMALFLLVAEKLGSHKRSIDNIGAKDGLLVGLGQSLALIPGCSRSGSTLTVAMLLNLKREDAARFSFLLGIPAIVLSGLVELKDVIGQLRGAGFLDLGIGLVVSTIVSYLAIAWLLKYLQHHSTWVFVIYRLIFGAVVLFLAHTS
jgi:undecaprenyl-diphosphatase